MPAILQLKLITNRWQRFNVISNSQPDSQFVVSQTHGAQESDKFDPIKRETGNIMEIMSHKMCK